MDKSLKIVQQLVTDFETNDTAYLAPSYSESQVRQDFIDKFFTALGWDVTHSVQKNPYEQEVKIENKVTMAGSQRRADYAFSVAPNFDQVKFFVEAKKPSRSLANADDYFQTIRYAWNTKIPIAVLTDFEEFHILDCRHKPNIKSALERKIAEYRYTDYANEETFAKIFHLFGREAVASGSLEKYAAALSKKGTKKTGGMQPVDDAFLEELDGYREILAKAFKKTNEELQGDELTEAVQRTIDRLVFIRFLEDKGIEDKQIITLHSQASSWKAFITLCKRLEPKYNGLVFKAHRILDSGDFKPPDDHPFAEICQKLADPASPYDFNQIPISILGSIYERFLGKVVHATDKRVKVEEKPEVRKAGGVYYTPEYIVKYIVKETVGKLLYKTPSVPTASERLPLQGGENISDGKTPEEIARMAFADIACGSGSFLIEVYAQLLDYHLKYYTEHPESVGKDVLFERDGKKYLTLRKKKEILTNNVYGVDIDFQATEVTQLSLYLKMLENATMNEAHQFGLFKETILPDLRQNIICGNSLIGRDILEGDLFTTIDEAHLKPMNFEDVFPKIMKRGGFDAVVGNPPYVRSQKIEELTKKYFSKIYSAASYQPDTFAFFIERAIRNLSNGGKLGYIIPNGILTNYYYGTLRKFILDFCSAEIIVNLKNGVFHSVAVDTTILVLKRESNEKHRINNTIYIGEHPAVLTNTVETPENKLQQSIIYQLDGYSFNTNLDVTSFLLTESLSKNSKTLDSYVTVKAGMKVRKEYVGVVQKNDKYKKFLLGASINPYHITWKKKWVHYDKKLESQFTNQAFRDESIFLQKEKILIRQVMGPDRIYSTIDTNQYYCDQTVYCLIPNNTKTELKYLQAIISSKLISYYFEKKLSDRKETFPKIKGVQIEQLPIYSINISNPEDKSRFHNIVKLVDQIFDAKQKLSNAKTESEVNRLETLCALLDRKIDEVVYELYGLTEEEIKIVENRENVK